MTWAFTFEDQPPFAGFRQLASCGINLPVLNVFKMFSRMRGQRVAVTSDAAVALDAIIKSGVRQSADVAALAAGDAKQLAVLVWHYHDDDVTGPDAEVKLTVAGLPLKEGTATLTQYRIDADHSNSYEAWKRMGAPQQPTPEQFAQLEKSSQLAMMGKPEPVRVQAGQASLVTKLPRQAVALLLLEWR